MILWGDNRNAPSRARQASSQPSRSEGTQSFFNVSCERGGPRREPGPSPMVSNEGSYQQAVSAQGLGRVETFALFSNVEFLTRFSEFRHRELLWRSVGDGTTRKLFLATIEKSRFHTARVIFDRSSRFCLPVDVAWPQKRP